MGIKKILTKHTRIMFDTSAKLRAQYGIKTPDAIQLAIGIENNGSLFITNDKALKKIKEIKVQ